MRSLQLSAVLVVAACGSEPVGAPGDLPIGRWEVKRTEVERVALERGQSRCRALGMLAEEAALREAYCRQHAARDEDNGPRQWTGLLAGGAARVLSVAR